MRASVAADAPAGRMRASVVADAPARLRASVLADPEDPQRKTESGGGARRSRMKVQSTKLKKDHLPQPSPF